MGVLLVEDEVLIRICLTEAMTNAGLKVLEASDAESLLELAGALRRPSMIVTDINLGRGMDGFTLVAAARRLWPGIPALLMTGLWTNFAGRHRGEIDCFMLKPFSAEVFLRNVTELRGPPGALPR